MNAPIVEELGIPMAGGGKRRRLAALIVLGIEMGYRRRLLGYEGGGSWQAYRGDVKSGKRKRWVPAGQPWHDVRFRARHGEWI